MAQRGIASGIQRGLESGQQFIANEQQQNLRDRQMAELERKEQMRAGVAAIDPTQFQRKTPSGESYFDQGAFQQQLANVDVKFGEGESAAKRFGSIDEWNRKQRGNHAARIAGLENAGDIEGMLAATKAMLAEYPNDRQAKDLRYDQKARTIVGITTDNKPFSIAPQKLYKTSLADMDPEKFAELSWKEQQHAEDMALKKALVRASGSGGGRTTTPQLIGDAAGPEGKRLPIHVGPEGYYTVGSNGKFVPYGGDIRTLRYLDKTGGGKGTASGDPVEAAMIKSLESDPTRLPELRAYQTEQAQKRELGTLAEEFQQEAQGGGYDIAVNNMVRRVSSEVRDPAKQMVIFQVLGIPESAVNTAKRKMQQAIVR